ncbi:MAG: 16S rRNA (uracil(1498)-N(3))-methyltransferase [Bacillota bacterium]
MTRFFVERVQGKKVVLDPEQSHHLVRVLRARPGERFTVVAEGVEYTCALVGLEGGLAVAQVLQEQPARGEPRVRLTLLQGLPKGDKMDTVVQKGTEIGVAEFVPVTTSRSVVRLEPAKARSRVERWQRIAQEAAQQCGRGAVPRVWPLMTWEEAVLWGCRVDLALVPWEEGGEPLKGVLEGAMGAMSVAIFIGPEGGLTGGEVELARKNGARVVSLGPRVLRTETAGLVSATAVLFAFGELG